MRAAEGNLKSGRYARGKDRVRGRKEEELVRLVQNLVYFSARRRRERRHSQQC